MVVTWLAARSVLGRSLPPQAANANTEAETRTNWLKRMLIPRDFAVIADVSIHLCWRGQAFAKLNRDGM
jgi:hypothetical protein